MQDGELFAEADKEFFLAIYRRAVEYYQPKIEKKTGVRLGKIDVWDHSVLNEHAFKHVFKPPLLIRAIRHLCYRRAADRRLQQLRDAHEQQAGSCSAVYYRNAIYVSFSSRTVHEDFVAATVVHELSHALWERFARWPVFLGPKGDLSDKYRLFIEGFATYGERIWFLDLYPINVRPYAKHALDPNGVYYKGLRKIQSLVKQFGPEILPQIPRKWKTL
jgi:hypothetical protein